jgi:hypothetical protein
MPANRCNSASAAVMSIYRSEALRHTDFSLASSNLGKTLLLVSIGSANETHLRAFFSDKKTYMLTPRENVDTMTAKHGVATSDDLSKLRELLSRALTSLSDQANLMYLFLLASQRLTWSG